MHDDLLCMHIDRASVNWNFDANSPCSEIINQFQIFVIHIIQLNGDLSHIFLWRDLMHARFKWNSISSICNMNKSKTVCLLKLQTNVHYNGLPRKLPWNFNWYVISGLFKHFFSPFLKVRTAPCVSSSGDNGTCYSSSDCTRNGGHGTGACANGLGVCCVCTYICFFKRNHLPWFIKKSSNEYGIPR